MGRRIENIHGSNTQARSKKLAANVSGWITTVMEHGSILQAWAGEFTVAGEVRA